MPNFRPPASLRDQEEGPASADTVVPAGGVGTPGAQDEPASEAAEYARLKERRSGALARIKELQKATEGVKTGSLRAAELHPRLQHAHGEYERASAAAERYLRENPDLQPVFGAARRFHALGISTVPPRDDASKAPVGQWKEYQGRLPSLEELWDWHHAGTSGLGIVTGRTDRADGCGIEMFEPEGRAIREGVFAEFLAYIEEAGLTECWQRIAAGYRERTPSGGEHYYWLCRDFASNAKLAMRPATEEELAENPKDKYRTLLETRGRGGYSVAAPTPAAFNASGQPWTVGAGSPETTAVITAEEREGILHCARLCNRAEPGVIHEHPERAKHETAGGPHRSPAGVPLKTRPGDVFNDRGPKWADLLEPHGWRADREEADGTVHWTRPGKAGGTSATTGNPQHEGDKFHCFTSSTEFEPDCSYSKFAVFTILEHDGDWSAAAAQLTREGYVPAEETRRPNRHASIPRLRVPPPAELDQYADKVIEELLSPIREAAAALRPDDPAADDAEWGDMKVCLDLVEPAARVLGGLGDLDLIDYGPASAMLRAAALPDEYLENLDGGSREGLEDRFGARFRAGWNDGAATGHEVPADLQPALDEWHPLCPIPCDEVEPRRRPADRAGAWPVRNFVSDSDDRGNAQRLQDHHGDRILFTHVPSGLGEYAFDGRRWLDTAGGGRGLAGELADQTIESLPVTEAMSLSTAVQHIDREGNPVSDRGRYWKWLNAQQASGRRSAMIACAATLPGRRVDGSVFDADPRWLNTPSGEVDLGRLEMLADGTWQAAEPIAFTGQHFSEHRHTRITEAPYDPAAACPGFEAAMMSWLGDEELVGFVGKLAAASIRGLVTLKLLVCLLGGRNSGKTTFLEILMTVLGTYATPAAPSILRKGRGGSTLTDDLDDLRGYRFVTTTETAGVEQMDEARVKRLTGGDRQRSRGLYKSSGAWDPFFIMWFGTNEMPRMSGDDAALWGLPARAAVLIPPLPDPWNMSRAQLVLQPQSETGCGVAA